MVSIQKFKSFDIVVISIITIIIYFLSMFFDISEKVIDIFEHFEYWQIDEIVPALLFFSLSLLWVVRRKNIELLREIDTRLVIEKELIKHRDHLDVLVHERTSELSKANDSLRHETKKRLKLQEMESRSQRLELAGTVAGQVAHDFNNLLAPITVYPEFIHAGLPEDHEAHAFLDTIENAAKKIAVINQDLLTMSRRGYLNLEVLDLNIIVQNTIEELKSRTSTITYELELCKDLMKIKGGGVQIHRILTNLIVNAQDAITDKGQIRILTENYYADDTAIDFDCIPKGEYVKLTISDSGCGIPKDIRQKIIDPFFSTKKTDKKHGSGLGLSVVDAVINDHNGYMDMKSEVGRGTSFYLYFPITRESVNEKTAGKVSGGSEKVLIVDDDDIQREVSSELLKILGYKVSVVESGEKAIEFLRDNPQDILILDMVIPGGIDGTETYQRALEIDANQKAIIVSGYSETERISEARKLGVTVFVRKPITRSTIAKAIRDELDKQTKIRV